MSVSDHEMSHGMAKINKTSVCKGKTQIRPQELEVRSFNHPYSLKPKLTISLRSDIMKLSVLGFSSDIRIELQAPVIRLGYLLGYILIYMFWEMMH